METITHSEDKPLSNDEAKALAEEEAGFDSTETPTALETETPVVEDAEKPPVVDPDDPPFAEVPAEEPEPQPFVRAEISDAQFQELLKKATEVDEIKAALEQRMSGVHGKVGRIEQVLHDLKAGSGKKFQMAKEDLAELFEEFPMFGEKALVGLNRAFERLSIQGGGGLSKDEAAALYEAHAEEREAKKEVKRLAKLAPDWVQVLGPIPTAEQPTLSPFRQWLTTQPVEYQTTINASVDAEEIAESIKTFKDTTAQKPPANKKPVTEQERRLRAAVQPRGSGGGPVGGAGAQDEDAAMLAGYKGELARTH